MTTQVTTVAQDTTFDYGHRSGFTLSPQLERLLNLARILETKNDHFQRTNLRLNALDKKTTCRCIMCADAVFVDYRTFSRFVNQPQIYVRAHTSKNHVNFRHSRQQFCPFRNRKGLDRLYGLLLTLVDVPNGTKLLIPNCRMRDELRNPKARRLFTFAWSMTGIITVQVNFINY